MPAFTDGKLVDNERFAGAFAVDDDLVVSDKDLVVVIITVSLGSEVEI